jgi:Methyltransferase domain
MVATFTGGLERTFTPLDQAILRDHRRRLLAHAHGRVLELGGSAGVNLELYPASDVSEITAVGVERRSRSVFERRAARIALPTRIAGPDDLDPPFDTVVATFVLSSRRDLDHVLAWVASTLGRESHLLFLDRGPRSFGVAGDLARPFSRMLGEGFAPPVDVPAGIRRAGCTVTTVERFGLSTLTLSLRSLVSGIARLSRPRKIPELAGRAER